ncbi:MAG TPA: PKD domain-containing protein, partial [Methanoculleus sp.]|nr:PKD domain-containing protein [Methanoculleus sp.]
NAINRFNNGDTALAAHTYSDAGGSPTVTPLSRVSGYTQYDIIRESTSKVIFKIGGSAVATHTTNVPTISKNMVFYSDDAHDYIADWVLVRKYVATEPTVSAWGSEEETTPKSIIADFTGLPTTGNVPLTVYFTDNSTAINATINTWQWSFGDSTSNATSENPAHTYTTSGLYTVILTVTNTSFSKTNTTAKTAYINATVNPDTPTADFTTTETCGNVGDTFYFIDFSTGGGLYAWNWSFGDGSYSEMRNPTHQYAGEGTYDVSLHVWGAYGDDSLLRSNLITVPCGAATPTPTPTVTPTGTPPVQEEIPEGHLTPLAFVVLAFMVCGLTVYTFADNQNRNYLYVATAAGAMIVAFLLGVFLLIGTISVDFVNTLDEVTVNETVMSTYDVQRVAITDTGFGYFFTFWGVVMLIIMVLAVVEIVREPQRRYEE